MAKPSLKILVGIGSPANPPLEICSYTKRFNYKPKPILFMVVTIEDYPSY